MRNRDSPSDSAAATKSRSTTDTAAPRTTRAMRGTVEKPTVMTISFVDGPEHRDHDQRQDDLRQRQDHVHGAHQQIVEPAAVVGGDEADGGAEHKCQRVASTAEIRIGLPPYRNRVQTS